MEGQAVVIANTGLVVCTIYTDSKCMKSIKAECYSGTLHVMRLVYGISFQWTGVSYVFMITEENTVYITIIRGCSHGAVTQFMVSIGDTPVYHAYLSFTECICTRKEQT